MHICNRRLLAGVYLEQEDSGFFIALCMVFMMLQAVIYVIVYKFSQMPIYWICENFIF